MTKSNIARVVAVISWNQDDHNSTHPSFVYLAMLQNVLKGIKGLRLSLPLTQAMHILEVPGIRDLLGFWVQGLRDLCVTPRCT